MIFKIFYGTLGDRFPYVKNKLYFLGIVGRYLC